MTPEQFQRELVLKGQNIKVDGDIGPQTKAAAMRVLAAGPDTPLTKSDVESMARRLRVTPAHIWTVYDVEVAGDPFINGMPTILFEPHIFSRLTKHRFDKTHPRISSRRWNKALYPRTQAQRYQQLLDAVALDVNAGFSAASYGGFQVLGQHWRSLGYKSAWDFVYQHSQSVGEQLEAFIEYVEVNGLADELRRNDWKGFARGYNGPGYAANRYDVKLAQRFAVRSRA